MMVTDNIYPVSSEKLFPKTEKQKEDTKKKKLAYEKEAPIIATTISHLQEKVDFYNSVYSITEETNPEKFMIEVAVNKRVAAILSQEIKHLEMEVKKYSNK